MKKIFSLLIVFLFAGWAKAQQLQTNISVHDPVMIKQDSMYYLFCTGNGIAMWSSADRLNWRKEKPVFETTPQWVTNTLPDFKRSFWAPDISYYNGLYYLYYSVSMFGKNTSAIGVATNKTLHTGSPDYKWTDHGKVIQSIPNQTNWNAIDPNLITSNNGTPYLFFGSFWDGIKMVRLNKDRLSVADDISNIPTVASRRGRPLGDDPITRTHANPIEGAFVFKKEQYFFLFASIDYCCKGPKSTYKMIVGRSKNIDGPYVDKNKTDLANGGGLIVLAGDKKWYGVGHNAVCTFDGADYLVFHGYDASDNGKSKLRIEPITWDADGWPVVAQSH